MLFDHLQDLSCAAVSSQNGPHSECILSKIRYVEEISWLSIKDSKCGFGCIFYNGCDSVISENYSNEKTANNIVFVTRVKCTLLILKTFPMWPCNQWTASFWVPSINHCYIDCSFATLRVLLRFTILWIFRSKTSTCAGVQEVLGGVFHLKDVCGNVWGKFVHVLHQAGSCNWQRNHPCQQSAPASCYDSWQSDSTYGRCIKTSNCWPVLHANERYFPHDFLLLTINHILYPGFLAK